MKHWNMLSLSAMLLMLIMQKEKIGDSNYEKNNVAVQLIKTIENLSFDYLKHNPGSSPSLFIKVQLDLFIKLLLKELEK